jgi:hypothetical protein
MTRQSSLLDAVCRFGCFAAAAVGLLVALAGCYAATHGGGAGAATVAGAGVGLLLAGAGHAVLLARGAR